MLSGNRMGGRYLMNHVPLIHMLHGEAVQYKFERAEVH